MDELRSSVRFPIKVPIAIHSEQNGEQHAETSDISAGGVLFTIDADMAIGSAIQFSILMPGAALGASGDVVVSCVGRVVRATEQEGRKAVAAVIDEYKFEGTPSRENAG